MVFIDLTEAFDSINRNGLWKILHKIGCPSKFVYIINFTQICMPQSSKTMPTDLFSISNGVKQGYVLAPTLFSILFSAMRENALQHAREGCQNKFRSDGNIFNLQRLKAESKLQRMAIQDLLFADDCALVAHSIEDIQ